MKHLFLLLIAIFSFNFLQAQFIIKKTVDCKCWHTSSGIYIDTVWHRESVSTDMYRMDHILDSMAYYYNDTLVGGRKKLKYYDSYGRDSLFVSIYLDTASQQWQIRYKSEFSYMPNGDKEVIHSNINGGGQWNYYSKRSYLYQGTNLLQEKYSYLYDTLLQTWNNPWKQQYYYNLANQPEVVQSSNWNDTTYQYEVSWRYRYIYNMQSRLDSLIYQIYHASLASWESRSYHVYDYDASGDTSSIQYFSYFSNQWYLQHYYEYVYSGNQLDTIRNYQSVPSSPNEALSRTIFEYGMVGVNEIPHSIIQLYPNPASANVLIETNDMMQQLDIYDMQGRKMENLWNISSALIDISTYPQGVYIVQITTAKGKYVEKLVVSR